MINKYFTLSLKVNTLETLLAGKINAVLTRRYTRGRDYYDLFWYLTRFPYLNPNFEFLKNALIQSGFPIHGKLEERWRDLLTEKVKTLDWAPVIKDLEVLIEEVKRGQSVMMVSHDDAPHPEANEIRQSNFMAGAK